MALTDKSSRQTQTVRESSIGRAVGRVFVPTLSVQINRRFVHLIDMQEYLHHGSRSREENDGRGGEALVEREAVGRERDIFNLFLHALSF